jgi:thiol-disulfide isomerase/thioredoxin/outer membrane lipoprotein-sorting protein
MMINLLLALALCQPASPEDIYNRYRAKVAGIESATGAVVLAGGAREMRYEFGIQKPGKFFVKNETQAFFCDGKKVWQYMPKTEEFNEPPFEHYGKGPMLGPFLPFFDGAEGARRAQELKLGEFDGRPALLAIDRPNEQITLTTVVDPQSLLPVAHIQALGGRESVSRYIHLKLNVRIEPTSFLLPDGAKPMMSKRLTDTLLPVGSPAPKFSLQSPAGGKVDLEKELRGAKLLWLNFWFYGCGPCQEELPRLEAIQKKFRSAGLRVLTINEGDAPDLITSFMKEKSFSFPVGMNGKGSDVVKQYGVNAFPTNYLIDRDGKIVARFIGFDEAAILAEMAKVGIR